MTQDKNRKSLRQSLLDGIQSSVQRAEKLSRLGKIKLDLVNLKQGLEKVLLALGTRTYQLLSEKQLDQLEADPQIVEARTQADEIYAKIAELRAEQEQMKSQPDSAVEGSDDEHEFV